MEYEIYEFVGDFSIANQMFWRQKFNSIEDAKTAARTVYKASEHLKGEDKDFYHVSIAPYNSDGFPDDVLFMITKEGETTDPGTIQIWDRVYRQVMSLL